MDLEDEIKRPRSNRKLLKVTFPDGTEYCYKNVAFTYLCALRKIGVKNLLKANMESNHKPWLTREPYPEYSAYMRLVSDGWYILDQTDTAQKYLFLNSINNKLSLNLVLEIGENLEPEKHKLFQKEKKTADSLLVTMPDGTFIGGTNPINTYCDTIRAIGIDSIVRRQIVISGKKLIENSKKNTQYYEIKSGYWLLTPGSTKDKMKFLKLIGSFMRIKLEVNII